MVTSILSKLFGRGPWELERVPPPWSEGRSIFDHVQAHVKPDGTGLDEGGERLPDEPPEGAENGAIRWAAGARDGVFGHHMRNAEKGNGAEEVLAALNRVVRDANGDNLSTLYAVLKRHSTLAYADILLEKLLGASGVRLERLNSLATWLARRAPDREPVKAGVALLNLGCRDGAEELLLTLGTHEEFTAFAAVAIVNTSPDPEMMLWKLAKRVHGWGRIQVIERLVNTSNPQIKAWLLREGFRNYVMYEYLAYMCAVVGDLDSELKRAEIDDALFDGAGEILVALIDGQAGPAESIDDYERAVTVIDSYLRHAERKASSLKHFNAVASIKEFLSREEGWDERKGSWTPEVREVLLERANGIGLRPDWKESIFAALKSKKRVEFWEATRAAKTIGVDVWEEYFDRVSSGEDYWYQLMETPDETHFERALDLARLKIPLGEIATGPSMQLGLGTDYAQHSHLDFVLQALCRYPKKGWTFIKAGMRSPTIRNRNIAVRALASWPRSDWPVEASVYVRECAVAEPDEKLRGRFDALLEGRPLER